MTKLDEWMSPRKTPQGEETFTATTQESSDDWQVFPSWHDTLLIAALSEAPASRRASLGRPLRDEAFPSTRRRQPRPVVSPLSTSSQPHASHSRKLRRSSVCSSHEITHASRLSLESPVQVKRMAQEQTTIVKQSPRKSKLREGLMKEEESRQTITPSQRESQRKVNKEVSQRIVEKEVSKGGSRRRSVNSESQQPQLIQQQFQEKQPKEGTKTRNESKRTVQNEAMPRDMQRLESKGRTIDHRKKSLPESPQRRRRRRRRESMIDKVPHRTIPASPSSRPKSRGKTRQRDPERHTSSPIHSSEHRRSVRSSSRSKSRHSPDKTRRSHRLVSTGLESSPVYKLVVRQRAHPGSHRNGSIEVVERSEHTRMPDSSTRRRRYSLA